MILPFFLKSSISSLEENTLIEKKESGVMVFRMNTPDSINVLDYIPSEVLLYCEENRLVSVLVRLAERSERVFREIKFSISSALSHSSDSLSPNLPVGRKWASDEEVLVLLKATPDLPISLYLATTSFSVF